jgi:hypothetical protein
MSRRLLPALFLLLALVPFAEMLGRKEVPLFRDHASYFLPLRWHTASSLAAGDVPLWNPFNGLGEPWAANPQTAVFYPPAWIFLALPFETAYVAFLWLHLGLLGGGAYVLFRRWADEVPSALGAAALMFCGPVVSLLDVGNNLTSFAWMPLVIRLALERRDFSTARVQAPQRRSRRCPKSSRRSVSTVSSGGFSCMPDSPRPSAPACSRS